MNRGTSFPSTLSIPFARNKRNSYRYSFLKYPHITDAAPFGHMLTHFFAAHMTRASAEGHEMTGHVAGLAVVNVVNV